MIGYGFKHVGKDKFIVTEDGYEINNVAVKLLVKDMKKALRDAGLNDSGKKPEVLAKFIQLTLDLSRPAAAADLPAAKPKSKAAPPPPPPKAETSFFPLEEAMPQYKSKNIKPITPFIRLEEAMPQYKSKNIKITSISEREKELYKLKNQELKQILKDKGLKFLGNKEKLVQTILKSEYVNLSRPAAAAEPAKPQAKPPPSPPAVRPRAETKPEAVPKIKLPNLISDRERELYGMSHKALSQMIKDNPELKAKIEKENKLSEKRGNEYIFSINNKYHKNELIDLILDYEKIPIGAKYIQFAPRLYDDLKEQHRVLPLLNKLKGKELEDAKKLLSRDLDKEYEPIIEYSWEFAHTKKGYPIRYHLKTDKDLQAKLGRGFFKHIEKDMFMVEKQGAKDIKNMEVKLLKADMAKAIKDSGLPFAYTGTKDTILQNFIRLSKVRTIPLSQLKLKPKKPKSKKIKNRLEDLPDDMRMLINQFALGNPTARLIKLEIQRLFNPLSMVNEKRDPFTYEFNPYAKMTWEETVEYIDSLPWTEERKNKEVFYAETILDEEA
jgi:hypothetical protein